MLRDRPCVAEEASSALQIGATDHTSRRKLRLSTLRVALAPVERVRDRRPPAEPRQAHTAMAVTTTGAARLAVLSGEPTMWP